jgi:hypothetical protein
MSKLIFTLLVLVVLAGLTTTVSVVVAWSPPITADAARYAEGAPPGFTGGFAEQSCHACHFHADLNAAPGRVVLEGVPTSYEAGKAYTIAIVLSRPDMKLAGFQLASRAAQGGAQAGSLAPGSEESGRIVIETQGGIQYANQRATGTSTADGTVRWTVVWTAPQSAVPVTFHVASNAADGDGTAEGDYIYLTTAESRPAGPNRVAHD